MSIRGVVDRGEVRLLLGIGKRRVEAADDRKRRRRAAGCDSNHRRPQTRSPASTSEKKRRTTTTTARPAPPSGAIASPGNSTSIGTIGSAEGGGIASESSIKCPGQKRRRRTVHCDWHASHARISPTAREKVENKSYLSIKGLTCSVVWRNRFSRQFNVDRHHRQHKRRWGLRQKCGSSPRDKTDAGGRDKAIGMPAEPKFGLQLENEREQVLPQPQASQ
mmetsp:Transcript_24224/g.78119  ORF Transcript_24224/g.78119 Transcript_24224/m.78119 type:complete len:220 (+) Transcript_24224:271-930(+)